MLLRLILIGLAFLVADRASAQEAPVDTALIVSVDVSGSVDQSRYALQMDGIAKALEDPEVIASMLSGPRGRTMFTMVEWSENAVAAIPWTRLSSREDVLALAARVRRTERPKGEFTCLAHMMSAVADLVLPTLPAKASRVVMDVSGDGIDNCDGDAATGAMRDALVATGMTINGLPINQGDPQEPLGAGAFRAPGRPFEERSNVGEIKTLEPWYRKYVIGGDSAFLIAANGYNDFDRAIKQKFALEVSGAKPDGARFARLTSNKAHSADQP
ncbi:MAG TPA: DUF1194 domain-containing protein [Rhodoblastus sp.]|nr:DUF1194 domain-containing protein [Rhodoblastus sp.]